MSDIIKLLPDSVANQIAAGEVIQRPASVVKELVENAIDAGATSVQIVLKDAGRTLIQVVDNGIGMSESDARLAFERHSTSKIRKADDLFSLHTMGFRGEALASIAAISQLELRTRLKGEQLGTKIEISASHCDSQTPDMCPQGSNFMVKNIFFNVPARRKFLKSNQVELSNIVKEFEKLALVNYTVEFSLSHNDKIMYKLMPGTFKQRISAVFGHNIDAQLFPMNIDTTLVNITGFVSKPENARKRNALQYMFVNGRYMRHPYFHKAILSSYGELIPDDEQPNYFLNFTVDPETIDVNIHPTKTEIKFENEMPIWQILSAAVKESLGRFSAVPTIDFDTEDAPKIPVFDKNNIPREPEIEIDPTYNPFAKSSKSSNSYGGNSYSKPQATTNWEQLYQDFVDKKSGLDFSQDFETVTGADAQGDSTEEGGLLQQESFLNCMQIDGRYILAPAKSGYWTIDQHRAHTLVLYNKYMSQVEGQFVTAQSMLFPVVIHLSSAQSVILQELIAELEKIGFNLSKLSGDDWSVNAIPAGVDNLDINDAILQLIESFSEGGTDIKDKIFEKIALSIAKSAAIPYGRVLKPEEIDAMLKELFKIKSNLYTPNGKKVMYFTSSENLTKSFS